MYHPSLGFMSLGKNEGGRRERKDGATEWGDNAADAVLRNALRYLPVGEYRRYGDWLLNEPAYRRRWLQVLGVPALLHLMRALLADLISDATMHRVLTEHGPPLLSYMIWEAASDNLAIGLVRRSAADPRYEQRRELVHDFNDMMLARLRGEAAEVPRAVGVSLLRQSLSEPEHRALLAGYLSAVPDADGHAIEFSVGPVLAANAAAAEHSASVAANGPVGSLFRDGLLRRYRAVNALLDDPFPGAADALVTGTDAILVAPTLAYLIGAVTEVTRPLEALPAALAGALDDAGLLVRLLNDCGTQVLEQSDDERREFLATLRRVAPGGTVADALVAVDDAPARLVKDIRFGEFNVCLDEVRDLPVGSGLEEFRDRLDLASAAYRQAWRRLRTGVRELEAARDGAPWQVIERFVAFHRRMYSATFETAAGEYAIGGG
jgi:hypothetical protein